MSKRFHSTAPATRSPTILADDDRPKTKTDRVLDRVAHTAGHGHPGDDHGVHSGGTQEAGEIRTVEGTRELLHDHLLAPALARCARRWLQRPYRATTPPLGLVVPDAHVGIRSSVTAYAVVVNTTGTPLRTPRRVEALNARDDRVHAFAGEWLPSRVHALARSMWISAGRSPKPTRRMKPGCGRRRNRPRKSSRVR